MTDGSDLSRAEDEAFMAEAIALARRGLDAGEMPIGAVVVLDGEVVASAYWRFAADALLDHAEVVALREAEKDPRVVSRRPDATLYTTLEPCLQCVGAAMSFNLGRLVYALEAPYDGAADVTRVWAPALGFPPAGFRVFSTPQIVGGTRRDEALALIREYVGRHPDERWLQAMLPGFSYPRT